MPRKKKPDGEKKKSDQYCVWDFTAWVDATPIDRIRRLLRKEGRRWAFQKERGELGSIHWQGRISFKVAKRPNEALKVFNAYGVQANITITSNANKNNMFYVMKDETRLEGPWTSNDLYIPRQIREIKKLLPWQETVKGMLDVFEDRVINVLIEKEGNQGKSTAFAWLEIYKFGVEIPPINKCNDLMQAVACIVSDTGCEDAPKAFFIDFPRCLRQSEQNGLYAALEKIKGGWAYDLRYSYKSLRFDAPQMWVAMNTAPEKGMLTNDRWAFWDIKDKKLVKYVDEKEELTEHEKALRDPKVNEPPKKKRKIK